MNIAFFDTKPYDRLYFDKFDKKIKILVWCQIIYYCQNKCKPKNLGLMQT